MKERGAAMIPTEDIMPIVKNTIAASIKCNTHRGYIGWSSCDNICMDMHDCLDMCAETLEMRGYMVALEAKAEENLRAKSLRAFCEKYHPKHAVRTSMSDFREQDWMTNIPLYNIDRIGEYLK